MSESDYKKYWYIKLPKEFFNRHDIKVLESMPNGKDYCLFYLKLLLESVTHNGELRFSETIPYDENMLSAVTNTNIDMVRSAMKVLHELHLVEMWDDQTIFMTEVQKMVGVETGGAKRLKEYRAKKLLGTNVPEMYQEKELEIEKDKEIDIELDKESEKDEEKEIMSFNEANKYLAERKLTNIRISRFMFLVNERKLTPEKAIEWIKGEEGWNN